MPSSWSLEDGAREDLCDLEREGGGLLLLILCLFPVRSSVLFDLPPPASHERERLFYIASILIRLNTSFILYIAGPGPAAIAWLHGESRRNLPSQASAAGYNIYLTRSPFGGGARLRGFFFFVS